MNHAEQLGNLCPQNLPFRHYLPNHLKLLHPLDLGCTHSVNEGSRLGTTTTERSRPCKENNRSGALLYISFSLCCLPFPASSSSARDPAHPQPAVAPRESSLSIFQLVVSVVSAWNQENIHLHFLTPYSNRCHLWLSCPPA